MFLQTYDLDAIERLNPHNIIFWGEKENIVINGVKLSWEIK